LNEKIKPAFNVWLQDKDRQYIFGEGPFELLKRIQEYGTLTDAAESLEMSYRHAWGIIKKIERLIGEPLIKTRKGGKAGGGGTELTEVGIKILERYSQIKRIFLKRP